MKNYFSLLLVLFCCFSQAQINYHFDYALVYKNSSELKESLYFINSRDNSYALSTQKNKDSVNSSINFIDFRGLTVNSLVDKTLFFQAETFNNDCSSVHKFSMDLFKKKAKEFVLIKHKDTLINDTLYFHYATKSLKKLSYQKRKKLREVHFIMDKNSKNFMPFIHHPTLYEHWVSTSQLPKGLITIEYHQSLDGIIVFKRELMKAIKIDKYLKIPNDCEVVKSLKLF